MLFQFEGVTKTYGAVTALNNLSLAVPEGAIGLLGPNGSGKTTMIRTLLGLIPVDTGTGQVLGKDFRTQQLDIRREVGFAPEDECLFPHVMGVDFVAYAGELGGMHRKDALQRAHETLDYVGLGEARYRKVESYSTGMKQRLKLASAIVHDPKMLILDEPTNGMDPAGRQEILELARDLAHSKGMSLLFSSHLLPDVEAVCDYMIVLGAGTLLAEGKIQDLKEVHRQTYEVRVKGEQSQFAARLAHAGCTAEVRDDKLSVQLPDGESTQILWRIAAESQEQIRHLREQHSSLEEVFLKALEQAEMPIFDQGYQHWSGTLSGHAWRWLPITRQGLRVALSGKMLRLVLLASWVPALLLSAVLCVWGLLEQKSALIQSFEPLLRQILRAEMLLDPHAYRHEVWTLSYYYFMQVELYFSMVLVLLSGPNLISQDLRYNALPLYLSRPLRRTDYFLGKLGVIVGLLGMVTIVPAIIAYLLGLAFSLDLTIVRDVSGIVLGSITYGLIIAVSHGLLMLALSSLSRNSRYIALLWLAIWIGTGTVSTFLGAADAEQRRHDWRRSSPIERTELIDREIVAAEGNWRPLVSYMSNLTRLGNELLGTHAAWEKLSQLQPPEFRSRFLFMLGGATYPWQWSAGVLAALMGVSIWILNRSIKSLDRLK